MEREAFQLMRDAERGHWWFRGRREFIRAALNRAKLPPKARILDAGCGSGGNLALLAEFGAVSGFEYDEQAANSAAQLKLGNIERGSLPDDVPFAGEQFDAIGLFDVLEHLPLPVESLRTLGQAMAPAGCLVVTVPANQWMWGPHDEVHQHYRRYSKRTLVDHLNQANLRVEYVSYFNSILFPLAIAQRLREKMFGYSADNLTPSATTNSVLFKLWSIERAWVPAHQLPFGLSLIAIARRNDA